MSVAPSRKGAKKAPSSSAARPKRSAPAKHPSRGVSGGAPALRLVAGAPVQTKVAIGEVNDPYEREADAVANSVVSGAEAPAVSSISPAGLSGPPQPMSDEDEQPGAVQMRPLQRMEEEPVQQQTGEEEAVQAQAGDEEESVQAQAAEEESVQAQAGDEEEPVQAQTGEEEESLQAQAGEEEAVQESAGTSSAGAAGGGRSPARRGASAARRAPQAAAEAAIHRSGPGTRLNRGTRSRLENSVGTDLGSVRVHEDNASHAANRDLGSRAFTHGSHIWLGPGESQNDVKLLAHETTHVLQQGGVVRRQPEDAPSTGGDAPAPDAASGAAGTNGGAGSPGAASASGGTTGAPAAGGDATAGPRAAAAPGPAPVQPAGESEEGPAPAAAGGGPGAAEASAAGGEAPAAATVPPAPAPAPAEGGGPGADVEMHMPEPPEGLSAEERERLGQVQGNAAGAAEATSDLPAAEESTAEARAAVDEPEQETAARAQNALVDALGERPAPSPEILELCANIRRVIREKRPPDEESLVRADPEDMASDAGGQLNESVEGDVDRVGSEYDQLQERPEGSPQQEGQPTNPPPSAVETPDVDATSANPEGVSEDEVDLTADVESNREQIGEAGMDSEVAEVIESGPVAEARSAMGELEETAERDPAEVLAEQQAILASSRADMAALEAQAAEALAGSRTETVEGSTTQQTDMVGSETDIRENLSRRAEEIFTGAQSRVDALLQPLTQTAMSRWEAGVGVLSEEFKQHLARVEDWIEERHSGGWGAVVSVWDDLTGLPGWVTDEYDDAERTFGDGVCNLITEISTEVNGVIAACEAIIADARTQITDLFTTNLPAELEGWAAEQLAGFGQRLDGLSERVSQTQREFNEQMVDAASSSVQEVRQQVHALREAAKGLIGRIADAIAAFVEDPVKFIIEGLLELVGIEPAAFWALVNKIGEVISDIADDPLGFANNLVTALAEGFTRFFDNIGTHLLQGLLDWLFSGLGSVGVSIPSDFSLKSIITFCLELMGITWPRVRALLAEEIGEENVALIEKAYELVSTLIEQGPQGLFDLLKEQFNPQTILDQVLQAAIDFLIEALIKQVSVRIIALFNPAGAIVQAIELIYRVLAWVFNNAARIFKLVETVVNGAAQLVAGNTSGLAAAIETALAGLLPTVIDFLAGYIGLGDLPEKIADVIRGFQEYIEGILRRIIKWLADRGRALLSALGIGGEEEGEGEGSGDYDGQIGKTVTWSADGESHRMWILNEGGTVSVMMASGPGTSILPALEEYDRKADRLAEEDPETAAEVKTHVSNATDLVTNLIPKAEELAAQIAESDPEDEARREAADDAIEALQDRFRAEIAEAQKKLGLNDDEQIEKARNAFPSRLFSASKELAPVLGLGRTQTWQRTNKWVSDGILFRTASAQEDPRGLYSFDPVKASQRKTSPNNRSKYGYSNPSKTSGAGLAILTKGLRPDSPRPRETTNAIYHQTKARYDSTRPGSSYQSFGFSDAILGHKEAMGASDHWNTIGHTRPKSRNAAWNRHPVNYQGPEHRTESAASGAAADEYRVPSKLAGSHSSWL